MVRRRFRPLAGRPAAEPLPPPDDDAVRALADALGTEARARLGRTLLLRHVDTGGCNACELELRATTGVLYDLERYGLRFVASPRHADALVVTGPPTRAMQDALYRTWTAMPDPKWVVALGDCAVDGGLFRQSYATRPGIEGTVPVDLVIPGCPPPPAAILAGLRALLAAVA